MRDFLRFLCLYSIGIALLLGPHFVAGCATQHKPPPDQPPAEKQTPIAPAVVETKGKVEAIKPPLAAATQLAPKLTPANVETERPTLIDHLNKSWAATLAAINSAKALETKAEGLDKANAASFEREKKKDAALEKAAETITQQNGVIAEKDRKIKQIEHDKAMRALWLGIVLSVVASIGGGVLFANGSPKTGVGLIAGGVLGVGVCLLGMTMQHFFYTHEETIGYGVCGLIVVGLCVGGYFAIQRLRESTAAAAKIIQTGIITGAVDFEKLAPIARTNETPLLAKIVNKTTSKDDRAKAVATADPDGPGNVAGVA